MNKRFKKTIIHLPYQRTGLIGLLIYLAWLPVATAEITARINPSKISLGQTFTLTLTEENNQDPGNPLLATLQTDFKIVGTERSMNYTIINGQAQGSSQWSIILMPKRIGTLPIPAIRIGQEQSPPTQIEVTAEAQSSAQSQGDDQGTRTDAPPFLLTTSVDQKKPYVRQQIILTVKLYNRERLLDAAYESPKIDSALTISLGDPKRYQETLNQQNYMVEEQQYAIFPQKIGKFTITGPVFNALVYDTIPRRVRLQGKTIPLDIAPIPKNIPPKTWLPAKNVQLSETYDQSSQKFLEGSTLVRTIKLQALGMPGQFLPTLPFKSGHQFSVYPEKPAIQNLLNNQELMGESSVKITYLFNHGGTVTIPAVEIPWFNTITHRIEKTRLPEKTVQVDAIRHTSKARPGPIQTNTTSTYITKTIQKSHSLAWIVAALFALAWIITLYVGWYRPQGLNTGKKRRLNKQLKAACLNADPSNTRDLLLQWAAYQWPDAPILNIHDIAKRVSEPFFKKQLHDLTTILYGSSSQIPWQGAPLWRCIAQFQNKKPTPSKKRAGLPPINPE